MAIPFRYKLELWQKRTRCFFVGHDERLGNRLNYEPPYCAHCFLEWPDDNKTMPMYLNRLFCWCVERDWAWFARLDQWLWDNYRHRLPRWWEY